MRIAALLVAMLGGCGWIIGLGEVRPPNGDGRVDVAPPPDALAYEDCRKKITFTEQPLLFPGFDAVSAPTIRGDFQEAYDIEDDLDGTNIHRWVIDPTQMMFVPADAAVLGSGTEDDPSVTSDGLEIAFISSRTVGVDSVWMSERDAVDQPWNKPTVAPGLEGFVAGSLHLSPDGLTLYAVDSANELCQFARTDRMLPFAPGPIVGINIVYPTVSADGLELISEINPTDTMVGLYEQIRSGPQEVFANPTPIVLPGAAVYEPSLSPDNHILLTGHRRFFTRSCQ